MRSLLFLVLASAISSVAAAEWTLVGDHPKLRVEVDAQSVTKDQGFIKAWFKWEYAETQYTNPDRRAFRSMKELNYFDCGKLRYAIAQRAAYSEPDGRGESVFSSAIPVSKLAFEEVIPDSIGESMLRFTCKTLGK